MGNRDTLTAPLARHGWKVTRIDEAIPGTSLRGKWLLTGMGADAVFSSDEMLEEWLRRVLDEEPVYTPTPIEQLDFLDKAA